MSTEKKQSGMGDTSEANMEGGEEAQDLDPSDYWNQQGE